MERKDLKTEEVELWPLPGGKKKIARIFSRKGKIHWIEIDDSDKGVVGLNSVSFLKLMRYLNGRDFEGAVEKLAIK